MTTLPVGVPALLENAADYFENVGVLLSFDTYDGYGAGAPPQWGLFLNGQPVVIADTVTVFDYKQNWAIADYPVERGGFETYDKVNTPYKIHAQFVSGGNDAKRQALLDSIAAIGDPLTLYDVITPEAVYIGVNVEGYSYRRTSNNGLGLMIVDVNLLEIREEGVTDGKNAKTPSAYTPTQTGNTESPSYNGSLSPR